MPLSVEQTQRLQEHLRSKGVNNCPVCGHRHLQTLDIIAAPVLDARGVVNIGGGEVAPPMVQVMCQNCSHVLLFAAGPAGLLQSQ